MNDVNPNSTDNTNPVFSDLKISFPSKNITRQLVAMMIGFNNNGTKLISEIFNHEDKTYTGTAIVGNTKYVGP